MLPPGRSTSKKSVDVWEGNPETTGRFKQRNLNKTMLQWMDKPATMAHASHVSAGAVHIWHPLPTKPERMPPCPAKIPSQESTGTDDYTHMI